MPRILRDGIYHSTGYDSTYFDTCDTVSKVIYTHYLHIYKATLYSVSLPVFPPYPSCVCSVLTIPALTEDGLEIELVSGIYFPEIHIMKYSICPPTTSCNCSPSLPVKGEFRLAPSLCTGSLKINSLMHMV